MSENQKDPKEIVNPKGQQKNPKTEKNWDSLKQEEVNSEDVTKISDKKNYGGDLKSSNTEKSKDNHTQKGVASGEEFNSRQAKGDESEEETPVRKTLTPIAKQVKK
jgi:hypothetical protein